MSPIKTKNDNGETAFELLRKLKEKGHLIPYNDSLCLVSNEGNIKKVVLVRV